MGCISFQRRAQRGRYDECAARLHFRKQLPPPSSPARPDLQTIIVASESPRTVRFGRARTSCQITLCRIASRATPNRPSGHANTLRGFRSAHIYQAQTRPLELPGRRCKRGDLTGNSDMPTGPAPPSTDRVRRGQRIGRRARMQVQ